MASNDDSLIKKSLNITLDRNEDWNMNENMDQSKVAKTEVFSQFNESDSQIWSENV